MSWQGLDNHTPDHRKYDALKWTQDETNDEFYVL